VHELGNPRQAPFPVTPAAPAHGISRLKRAVREQHDAFEASIVLREVKASGTQLIQELIVDGLPAVTGN
jgi:hypothetical protein